MTIKFRINNMNVEIHILDLIVEDFYGKDLVFTIVGFIREMGKFTTIDELISSINNDIEFAKSKLNSQ